jgi:hypothetical protein
MKRQAKKIYPTMKINTSQDNDIEFEECQCEIVDTKDVESKLYGEKTILVLKDTNERVFGIFINNYSMENLINSFGEDDKNWKGKLVDLTKEQDAQFKKDMIVVKPVA